MKQSCVSQDVWELQHAPKSRFWGVNDPWDMSNNLALGQPWLSELETIDTTEIENLGFTCAVAFIGFVLSNSLVPFKMCGK